LEDMEIPAADLKDQYIQAHKKFIAGMTRPDVLTFNTLNALVSKVQQDNKSLHKTISPYEPTLEPFAIETLALIQATRAEIEHLLVSLDQKIQSEREQEEFLSSITKDIAVLQSRIRIKDDLQQKIATTDQRKQSAVALQERIEREISSLKEDPHYVQYQSLIESKQEIARRLMQIQEQVRKAFTLLSPAFKAWSKKQDTPLLSRRYADDPVDALMDDDGMFIKGMLATLRDLVSSGAIQVDKPDQVITATTSISDKLDNFRRDLLRTREEKKALEHRSRRDSQLAKLDDLLYRQEHAQKQLERIEQDLADVNEMSQTLNLDFLKKKIQDNLRATLNREIVIE